MENILQNFSWLPNKTQAVDLCVFFSIRSAKLSLFEKEVKTGGPRLAQVLPKSAVAFCVIYPYSVYHSSLTCFSSAEGTKKPYRHLIPPKVLRFPTTFSEHADLLLHLHTHQPLSAFLLRVQRIKTFCHSELQSKHILQ